MKEHNSTTTHPARRRPRRTTLLLRATDSATLAQMYRAANSTRALAALFGCSAQSVRNELTARGIPMRAPRSKTAPIPEYIPPVVGAATPSVLVPPGMTAVFGPCPKEEVPRPGLFARLLRRLLPAKTGAKK